MASKAIFAFRAASISRLVFFVIIHPVYQTKRSNSNLANGPESRVHFTTTSDEICELILKEMSWYGFTFVTVWSLLGPGKELRETFDLNTRPQSYIDHYNKAQYVDRDPVVTAMRRALTSLSWSDVKAQNNLSK